MAQATALFFWLSNPTDLREISAMSDSHVGMTDDQIELVAACCAGVGLFLLIIWAYVVLIA